MICNEEIPNAKAYFRQYLALGVSNVWNPWLDCVNLHIILSLNPGIVEYHPAYFSHCSHTFFVILVSRICLMKALVPSSQRFFLKFLFVEERGETETRFFSLSSPLRCSLFSSRRKIWRKTSGTRVRPCVLTWFDHSLLSRNFKVNSVVMTVIFKWQNSDYKKTRCKENHFCHTPLVAMPSRPPQPDLYFKLKKCIHIITLER